MTQTERIFEHMKSGRAISPLEALNRYGCFRLGARIHDIKKLGWFVKTETVYSDGKHFASYSLTDKSICA